MAKKVFNVNGLMDEFKTNTDADSKKKEGGAEKKSEKNKEIHKGKGSSWRAKQRTAAKTIHFDPKLSSKINQIKEWRKLAGEDNATVEDLVHEMCEEYINRHLDELKEKYSEYII